MCSRICASRMTRSIGMTTIMLSHKMTTIWEPSKISCSWDAKTFREKMHSRPVSQILSKLHQFSNCVYHLLNPKLKTANFNWPLQRFPSATQFQHFSASCNHAQATFKSLRGITLRSFFKLPLYYRSCKQNNLLLLTFRTTLPRRLRFIKIILISRL